jgi:hypothetical protein
MGLFSFGDDDASPSTQEPTGPKSFSAGPQPIDVGESWREFDLGFQAASIAVRGDQPLLVAVEKPYNRADRHIFLDTQDLPFSMGGDVPIGTDTVWVRTADSATSNASVQITAV